MIRAQDSLGLYRNSPGNSSSARLIAPRAGNKMEGLEKGAQSSINSGMMMSDRSLAK